MLWYSAAGALRFVSAADICGPERSALGRPDKNSGVWIMAADSSQ